MSASEFEGWKAFYRMFPFDDLHRYHRPAGAAASAIAGALGARDTYTKVIEFLSPEPVPPGMTAADWNTVKAFRSMGVGQPRKKEPDGSL